MEEQKVSYCLSFDGDKMDELFADPTTNIIFNLLAGVTYEDLDDEERSAMSEKFGENWAGEFGFKSEGAAS